MSRCRPSHNQDDEDDDDGLDDGIPLHHKQPFGSGISKRPVKFVPASADASPGDYQQPAATSSTDSGKAIADLYLSIVMPSSRKNPESGPSSDGPSSAAGVSPDGGGGKATGEDEDGGPDAEICPVCKLPVASADDVDTDVRSGSGSSHSTSIWQRHEASLAHQVSLAHSHPPSAIDRSRMGLAYLQSYGWDPDSRRGLGAEAQGIAFPLKARPREDRLGIGADEPVGKHGEGAGGGTRASTTEASKKRPGTLDASKVRKKAQEDRKKTERLRQQLYGSVDLEKYLGPGA